MLTILRGISAGLSTAESLLKTVTTITTALNSSITKVNTRVKATHVARKAKKSSSSKGA